MNLLLIGGTGFFGPTIVRRALDAGHEVLVYHRGAHESHRIPDVPHLHGSTLEIHQHLPEIASFNPDAAIDTTQFMAETTSSVINALTGICERYVVVSSGDVYRAYGMLHRTEPGPLQEMPVDESADLRTKPSADQTDTQDNIFAERAARGQTDLPATVVRAPAMFGAGDRQGRIGRPIQRLREADGVLVRSQPLAEWNHTYGYVDNIADALLLCAEDRRPTNATYNVGYPDGFTILQILRYVADAIDWEGEITTSPDVEPEVDANWDQDLVMDTSRIRDELGYKELVPMEEAVRRSVEWELTKNSPSP